MADPQRRKLLLSAGAALGVAALQGLRPALAQPSPPVTRAELIDVDVNPIATFSRMGLDIAPSTQLQFRGGLVMSSEHPNFGGWSGLIVDDGGRRMLMVSDEGSWFTADIAYQGGRPKGLSNCLLGPIVGLGGRALDKKRDLDAECLALLDGTTSRGSVLIGFERNQRIGRFAINERGLEPPTAYLKVPAEARRMRTNKGFEALTVIRDGKLRGAVVVFAEEYIDRDGNHTGWLWPNLASSEPQRLALTVIDEFQITDVASLAGGSVLILERKFRWLEGVRMRLRLVPAAEFKPGGVMTGTVILEADLSSQIDNMEGMSVHRSPTGETIITLVSDDNFNETLQRSILLQFAYKSAGEVGRG